MRPRTVAVLFLVVAGLASFIWFVERDLPGSDERLAREKKLLSLDAETIDRLEIEGETGLVVFERRADGDWELTDPIAARADQEAVQNLLTRFATLEKERTFTDGSPEQLGLAPPRAVLTLSGPAGEVSVRIGGEVPASASMIVASGLDGPFHVVPGVDAEVFERAPSAWRSRAIFPRSRDEIVRLTLEKGSERVTLARRGDDFFLESPLEDRADEGTVSRFLDAVVGLEAIEFLDQASATEEDSGLTEGNRSLTVETEGEETPWQLTLGRPVAGDGEDSSRTIHLRADGHVYLAADSLSEAFERSSEEWRSLEWAAVEVFGIESLEVRDATGTLLLEREGGDWKRDGVKVEYSPVSDLLYAIAGTKAEALGADDEIAGVPLVTLTINPGADAQVLRVFGPAGDRFPATADDRDAPLWLGGDRVRGLLSRIAEVRAAAAVEEPVSEAGPDAAQSAPGASTDPD